jgi:hypothetical protein
MERRQAVSVFAGWQTGRIALAHRKSASQFASTIA